MDSQGGGAGGGAMSNVPQTMPDEAGLSGNYIPFYLIATGFVTTRCHNTSKGCLSNDSLLQQQ